MKGIRIVLALSVFCLMIFCVASVASARSKSLTTTIVITVKAEPKGNLLPDDQNADIVKEMLQNQPMAQPYIKEETQNIKSVGEKIYTITDRL